MRGMGRIFQRGPVYWIAYYHRGKEYRESTKTTTEKAAIRLLKKRLGEMGRGKLIGPSEERVTFEDLVTDLKRDYSINHKRSAKTLGYQLKHLCKSFALMRAVDITTDRIRAHALERQATGAKNATINRELAALRRMFSLAVQAGRLSARPHVPMLEENNARQGFLDHGSFLALREALPKTLKDPVTFLYLSGWRVSEMRGLEWRDVDRAGHVIRLRPELSKNKIGCVLPLSGELLDVIERTAGRRRLNCPWVFNVAGNPICDFRGAWRSACIAAGLGALFPTGKTPSKGKQQLAYQGLIPHDLRRSAIRNMVRAGIPERVCMALSGHKTRAIFDRYNIVSESDLTSAAQRLHQHLRDQPKESRVATATDATRTEDGQISGSSKKPRRIVAA